MLSAFLDLYTSSRASAVQFCLLGDEEGFLVYPENCTFTASGKTLGFVLEKSKHLDLCDITLLQNCRFQHTLILRSGANERKKMKGFSHFWQAGNTHCYYKTLVKLHRTFKC